MTERAHLDDVAEWWEDVFDRTAVLAKALSKDPYAVGGMQW